MKCQRPLTALVERITLSGALLERAVAACKVFDLRDLEVEKLGLPDLEIGSIPDDATVIDLRTKAEYEAWHAPNALHLEFSRALRAYPSFDRGLTYVLYCEIGLKSAHLAELMRAAELTAYHIPAGVQTLRVKLRGRC